jgi:hypothetical protein
MMTTSTQPSINMEKELKSSFSPPTIAKPVQMPQID